MNHPLKTWSFDIENDRSVESVLTGKKTAVTFLYGEKDIPIVGEEAILVFSNEKKACITKTKQVIVTEFKNIHEELSSLEGEETFEEWKKAHIKHFKHKAPDFTENTKVVFAIFEITKNLVEERRKLAETIAQANRDLLGKIESLEEINAGFNNSIFCVNHQYILKVCGDTSKENQFDVEAGFYKSNQKSGTIPALYRYDQSKKIVPYVYEIIEKVNGKSVYYDWYKMNETQREALVRQLVTVIKNIHAKEYPAYDWSSCIKGRILSCFEQTKDMFNEEERGIILASLEKYDKLLCDNRFCLIHNDLHFDNILLDDQGAIKLIDFNDSIVAPFDFDLRLLYMSVFLPWKWANIEMDPLQKPEDYQNLFQYILKYYAELREVGFLEERMRIYWILNDFELLPRFRGQEEKERIVMNSKRILQSK